MGLALKFAGIAIEAFIVSSLLSQAYQLISAKSDTAVMLGFLLLVLTIAGAILLTETLRERQCLFLVSRPDENI